MPLPAPNTKWPPQDVEPAYTKMREWAAWYSGEPSRIADVYATPAAGSVIQKFWTRARTALDGNQRAQLHVPVASDLAAVSGALIFGTAPRIRIRPAHEAEVAKPTSKPAPPEGPKVVNPFVNPDAAGAPDPGELNVEAKEQADDEPPADSPEAKAERRILQVIERGDVFSRLLEGAETAAAMGGAYIYPVWDEDLFDHPVLAVAQPDNALPEFKWGFLTAVTFWRVVQIDGNRIWRHVERHEVQGTGKSRRAHVLNEVYLGSEGNLGTPVGLGAVAETASLKPDVELPFPELDVEYVPNIRPNRLWRASGLGVADIQGSEGLLDAIDETYASWMRDIRLAKARIIVPRDYLRPDPDDPGGQAAFDVDHEIYTTMEMEPSLNADARAMMAHQFAIRFNEHRSTAREFIERVVSNAGYTPGTLGSPSDVMASRTGAALRANEHKTLLTVRRKAAWWRTAVGNALYHLAVIDREVFGASDIPKDLERSDIAAELREAVIDNPLELAQTALAMKSAEAASQETRVRTLHPDWTDAEVAAEVARITDEKPSDPVPFVIGQQAKNAGGNGNQDDQTGRPITDKSEPRTASPE